MDKFCPYCQMPLRLLHVKSPSLHLESCFRRKKPKKECPKGVGCESCMICHFQRFSHKALAKKRNEHSHSFEVHSSPEAACSLKEKSPLKSKKNCFVQLDSSSTLYPDPTLTPQRNVDLTLTPQRNVDPTLTLQQNVDPTLTPQRNVDPTLTPQRNVDPTLTPQQNVDPTLTPQRNVDPTLTPLRNQENILSKNVKNLKSSKKLRTNYHGLNILEENEKPIENCETSADAVEKSPGNTTRESPSDLKTTRTKPMKRKSRVSISTEKRAKLSDEVNNNMLNAANQKVMGFEKLSETTEDIEAWPLCKPRPSFVPDFRDDEKISDLNFSEENLITETGFNYAESPSFYAESSSLGFGFTSTQVGTEDFRPFVNLSAFQSVSPIKSTISKSTSENISECTPNNTGRNTQKTPLKTASIESQKTTQKCTQKYTKENTLKHSQKTTPENTQENTQKATQKNTQNCTKENTLKHSQKSTQKNTQENTQKNTQKATQKNTQKCTQKSTPKNTSRSTLNITTKNSFLNDIKSPSNNVEVIHPHPSKSVKVLKELNPAAKEKNARKQGDIGAMLFGLKPKEIVAKKKFGSDDGVPRRTCPFYKKVEGTSFAVDAFNYGEINGISHYFLSHFHYDHYIGLSKKWENNIYCSPVTGNLVKYKLRIEENRIKRIQLNKPVCICEVEVTFLEANHCPGAVLILLKLKSGKTILHTGDFRATESLINNPILKAHQVNLLYLDTTYLDPNFAFPPQDDVVSFTSTTVWKILRDEPRTLVVTGTYFIGKEKIFLDLGRELKTRVCVTKEKQRTMTCYNEDKLAKALTTDKFSSFVHVLQMKQLNKQYLSTYLSKFGSKYKQVVAIKPTGWTHSNKSDCLENIVPARSGNVITYGVPYSEHSSFNELKSFVESLKPDRVVPTVNVGKAEKRKMMESYLNEWKRK